MKDWKSENLLFVCLATVLLAGIAALTLTSIINNRNKTPLQRTIDACTYQLDNDQWCFENVK